MYADHKVHRYSSSDNSPHKWYALEVCNQPSVVILLTMVVGKGDQMWNVTASRFEGRQNSTHISLYISSSPSSGWNITAHDDHHKPVSNTASDGVHRRLLVGSAPTAFLRGGVATAGTRTLVLDWEQQQQHLS